MTHMRSWVWFVRKFGVRRAYRYWRLGRERGWMDRETARELRKGETS